jgi:hypothetical protein
MSAALSSFDKLENLAKYVWSLIDLAKCFSVNAAVTPKFVREQHLPSFISAIHSCWNQFIAYADLDRRFDWLSLQNSKNTMRKLLGPAQWNFVTGILYSGDKSPHSLSLM